MDEKSRSEITVGGEARAGIDWLGLLKLMTSIKSVFVGSVERRWEMRQKLHQHSYQLIEKVNRLLDDARLGLRQKKRPDELLFIIDNLDRVPPSISQKLFFDNGENLKKLRTHVIYTVPIASALAPNHIGMVFDRYFTLPMVKVRKRDGKSFRKGRNALFSLLGQRMDMESIFDSRRTSGYLVEMCGGSVRDLMRLINEAQLIARVRGRTKIDRNSAKAAVGKLLANFEDSLIPKAVYFPLLANVHHEKGDPVGETVDMSVQSVQEKRRFFRELLFNGSVLKYNGDENWYDVHPIVQQSKTFKRAMREIHDE